MLCNGSAPLQRLGRNSRHPCLRRSSLVVVALALAAATIWVQLAASVQAAWLGVARLQRSAAGAAAPSRSTRGGARSGAWLLHRAALKDVEAEEPMTEAARRRKAAEDEIRALQARREELQREQQAASNGGQRESAAKEEDPMAEAVRLRQEAEAELRELQARREELKQQQEAREASKKAEVDREALDAKIATIEQKLKRAAAFNLPEKEQLQQELTSLQSAKEAIEVEERKKLEMASTAIPQTLQKEEMQPASAQAQRMMKRLEGTRKTGITRFGRELTDEDWVELAKKSQEMDAYARFELGQALGPYGRDRLDEITEAWDEKKRLEEEKMEEARFQAAQQKGRELSENLTLDKLKAMSLEEQLQVAQDAGPAFATSVFLVGLAYWTVTFFVVSVIYHETTGEWLTPSLDMLNTADGLQTTGIVAGLLSLAALLKPVRIFLALLLTPWSAENIVPRLPWSSAEEAEDNRNPKH